MPATPVTQEADERRVTVLNRHKPELDPIGLRLGSFLLYPALDLGHEFDDNIYRTEKDREADLIAHITPRVRLLSDWNNHALEVDAKLDAGRHYDNSSEDFTDWGVGALGRVDFTRASQLLGRARFDHLHEDRGSPDGAAGERPTRYDRGQLEFGGSHRVNRVTLSGQAQLVSLDFDDGRAADGSRVNNDDRDRDVWAAALQLSYEIVPAFQAFIRGAYNFRDYRLSSDDFGLDRDSEGYELALGTEFDLTGVTYGSVYAGYREQNYEDDRLSSVGGFSFGGQLVSNITPITTVQVSVQSEIEETSVNTAEGFWSTSIQARLDHELLRNLILSGGLTFLLQEYEGIDRDDEVFVATAGATWQANRFLAFGGKYIFESRESQGRAAGIDYVDNRVLLQATGRY